VRFRQTYDTYELISVLTSMTESHPHKNIFYYIIYMLKAEQTTGFHIIKWNVISSQYMIIKISGQDSNRTHELETSVSAAT
jgi:hypothetical protein